MQCNLCFKVNGKLHVKAVKGFSNDVAKDLGKYSFGELCSIVGIETGAVLGVVK